MDLCTSISKLLIFCVVYHRCLPLRRSSMAVTCSVRVVLLHLAGVVRITCDIRLLDLVVGLVPLADVVVILICD